MDKGITRGMLFIIILFVVIAAVAILITVKFKGILGIAMGDLNALL